jgi:hypothetical protein
MLDSEVRHFIDTFGPNDEVVFIVCVNADPQGPILPASADRLDKIAARIQACRTLKAPYLSLYKRYGRNGLQILGEMDGASTFVVGGPPAGWRIFLREQQSLLDAEELTLIPNEEVAISVALV